MCVPLSFNASEHRKAKIRAQYSTARFNVFEEAKAQLKGPSGSRLASLVHWVAWPVISTAKAYCVAWPALVTSNRYSSISRLIPYRLGPANEAITYQQAVDPSSQ